MTTPARSYSWAPFEVGHWRSLKHGASSPRKVRPLAAKLAEAMLEAAPWLRVPTFASAVLSWSTAEAHCILLRAYLDEHGLLDDKGEPRPAMSALNDAERRADRARQQLGLTPSAWAALYRTLTVAPDGDAIGIEALRNTGRLMLEATTSDDDGSDER